MSYPGRFASGCGSPHPELSVSRAWERAEGRGAEPRGAELGRGGPSRAEGIRILVLRPVHSGADAWDAGARSESYTRVSLLCGALGPRAVVRTELSVLVGCSCRAKL